MRTHAASVCVNWGYDAPFGSRLFRQRDRKRPGRGREWSVWRRWLENNCGAPPGKQTRSYLYRCSEWRITRFSLSTPSTNNSSLNYTVCGQTVIYIAAPQQQGSVRNHMVTLGLTGSSTVAYTMFTHRLSGELQPQEPIKWLYNLGSAQTLTKSETMGPHSCRMILFARVAFVSKMITHDIQMTIKQTINCKLQTNKKKKTDTK